MSWSSSKEGPSLACALSTETSMRRSFSSTVAICQGMRVLLVPRRPILTPAYSGGRSPPPHVRVDRGDLPRSEGASGAQEAHLDADVLGGVVLVDEQVVYLADLLAVAVVDGVVRVLVFDRREPVAALLHSCDLLA